MAALRAGIFIIDAITLEEVTPIRDYLEARGAQVITIIPSGGARLPITGRYYPAAGGQGQRRALSQLSCADLDLLVLPARITAAHLRQHPHLLALARGKVGEGTAVPVVTEAYLSHLREHGLHLARQARKTKAEARTPAARRR